MGSNTWSNGVVSSRFGRWVSGWKGDWGFASAVQSPNCLGPKSVYALVRRVCVLIVYAVYLWGSGAQSGWIAEIGKIYSTPGKRDVMGEERMH